MTLDTSIFNSDKKSTRRMSRVEQEAMLKMFRMQDHMSEIAIQVACFGQWWSLPQEQRDSYCAEFRAGLEEKNCIFPLPKDAAIQDLRKRLGCDQEAVESHGDKEEKELLKQVEDGQRKMERELRRLALKAQKDARRSEKAIKRGNIKNAAAQRDRYRGMAGCIADTFERITGRRLFLG